METSGVNVIMTANVPGALLLHTQCAAREIHLLGFTYFVQGQNVTQAPGTLSVQL